MQRASDIPSRLVQAAGDAAAEVRAYLASEEGRRLRQRVATGLVFAAPALARLPWMRAGRLGRFVGMAGGAALIVKLADAIRDWEPLPQPALQVVPGQGANGNPKNSPSSASSSSPTESWLQD